MTVREEIEKAKEFIKQVEDPAVASALRHICNALEAQDRGRGEAHHHGHPR